MSPARRGLLALLVCAGGALGTAARVGLSQVLPGDGLPWGTLVANLIASFALGVLLEALLRADGGGSAVQLARLGLGTGVCGGLSTFSSLALEVVTLVGAGEVAEGIGYAAGSLLLGLAVAALGVWVGGQRVRGDVA